MTTGPYPRGRTTSRERGGANQGSDAYRMIKGFWGNKPLVKLKGTDAKEEEKGAEGRYMPEGK